MTTQIGTPTRVFSVKEVSEDAFLFLKAVIEKEKKPTIQLWQERAIRLKGKNQCKTQNVVGRL